jgi:hypothetical protein
MLILITALKVCLVAIGSLTLLSWWYLERINDNRTE